MTSPRKSRNTLRRVERAAMRLYDVLDAPLMGYPGLSEDGIGDLHIKSWQRSRWQTFINACAAHAAAKAKRR